MSDKTVITYKRKRSSSQSDLTKARKVDSSEKTEQEMLPKAELDAFDERFDQVSVMPDIGKEAAAKIEPHEAFSRVRCDAEIVGESQPPCSHGESMGLTTTDTTKNYITVENEQPDLTQNEIVTREETGDKVVEERGHENLVKPQSSTPNRAVVLPDENSDGKAKKTEGLVNVDKALQEFSDVERIGVYSGQASYRMASSLRPVGSSVQNQLDPEESRSKAKLPFSNLRGPAHKKHQLTEASDTSYVCANSPDTVGPKISLEDFRNIPSSSSGLNFKNSVHQDDRVREIQWPDFGDDTTYKSQHQHMFNNATHAWHSTLSDKPRRILAPWSEPELDFLWIGVRRHGLNNWNAILKDPILCFLRSRVAKDLAEQWSREHKKLLDDTPSQPTRPYSAPALSPSPFMPRSATHVCYSGNISLPSGLQTERAETTFSPRGLFTHNDNTRGSIPVGRTPVNHHLGSNPARSDYSITGIRYPRNFEAHNIKNQFETSTLHRGLLETPRHEVQSPPGSSITLPHWLSEALKRNQERLGLANPSTGQSILENEERIYNPNFENLPAPDHTVASRGNAGSTRVDEPWFPERSCIIPVQGITFQGFSSVDPGWDTKSFDSSAPSTLGMIIGETSKDAVDAGLGPNNALDWNKKSSGSVGPSNLGMIHEDTSSEDTISDDQIGKNQTYNKLV